MTWIQTINGKAFDFAEALAGVPQPIEIDDIAHALAHLCRFAGQSHTFYSVAEHSVLVARRVMQMHAQRCGRLGPYDAAAHNQRRLWCAAALLHDGSEAYLVDLPAPLKHLDELAGYRHIERAVQEQVWTRFGLEIYDELAAAIGRADKEILALERERLFFKSPREWQELPSPPRGDLHVRGLAPPQARAKFLAYADAWGLG